MTRIIFILSIFALSCSTVSQPECEKTVVKEKYNLSICLEEKWYVDDSSPIELIIGDKETQTLIKFRTWKNNTTDSAEELWKDSYMQTYNEEKNYLFLKKEQITRENVDIYIEIHKLQQELGGTFMIALTGVIKSKDKVCHIQCPYVEKMEGAEEFAMTAIHNLKFLNE